jgi:phosphonate transport system substrate-binding protein
MKNFLSVLLLCVTMFSCHSGKSELGTKKNPVKMYFTPSVDAETITSNSKEFIKFLEKETGLYFESGIPTSYIAVVEALGSDRADIAVMNSFGYIMANEKYGAEAKLTVIRHGSDTYQGQIITHVDSNVKSLEDLKGKNFAFPDPTSTSGYLFPLKVLRDAQVEPKNVTFANKHDNVVTMVYQKVVHAGATFYSPPAADGLIRDARARVITQFPDVEEKVKIVALTDPIKNDPFVFRKDLPAEVTTKVLAAIRKYLDTEAGKEVFRAIYSVDDVVEAKDSDYDALREMIKVLNLNTEELLKK